MQIVINIPDEAYELLKSKSELDSIAESIIANGTPVSTEGDLISRSELKKAFEELAITEELVDYDCDDVSTTGVSQYLDRPDVLDLIDNAPTVKFSLMPADETKEDAYKRGYEKGKIAGILKANTRPQGEWISPSRNLDFSNRDFF